MNNQTWINEENEAVSERFALCMERIRQIAAGEEKGMEAYLDYFQKVASFFVEVGTIQAQVCEDKLKMLSLEELEKMNESLYQDIIGEAYDTSYANPSYAASIFGEDLGSLLCFLYTEGRGAIAYAFENRLFDMTIVMELFLEVYRLIEDEEEPLKAVKAAIYYYVSDYSDITIKRRLEEMLDPNYSILAGQVMELDLSSPNYLYLLGEYVSENERKLWAYFNRLPQEKIEAMADTFTQGYKKGFENYRIDLSKKSVVNLRYPMGFERMVQAIIRKFKNMGLDTTIYRAAVSSIHKKQHLKIGFHGTSPNKQYDYDHRGDQAIYLDKAFHDRKLAVLKNAFESLKEAASNFAGPSLIETFGDIPFQPISKKEALSLSDKQQKYALDYQRSSTVLTNQYIKGDETSFTIIAYPNPEIGDQFEAIFDETVKVNTLDMELYEDIQTKIIDALDQGEYVQVTGRGKNRTNIKIQLPELEDPEKETNFENCLADVNIPVGEVFTSPKLKGTEGVLHVSEVYLRDLNYLDLELVFKDGKITSYACKNFEEAQENKKYIKENLLYQHDTLPIGEFAIGTNTTAYAMGRRFQISALLPILIAEKTGPHFAVGDTCFTMSEDMKTYNPDGKEMKAKENECSALRKTDIENAYFGCHTDITIPYHELGDIIVHTRDQKEIAIIREGRFVLSGTQPLNEALDALE